MERERDEYYSRIDKNDRNRKEELIDHLQLTGELCSKFTSKFTHSEIGQLLGEYHDLGKASKRFQDVLLGKERKIDHSIVGAWSLSQYNRTKHEINKFLSNIIAAHHSYLKNKIPQPISNSNKTNIETFFNNMETQKIDDKRPAIATYEELVNIEQYRKKYEIKSLHEKLLDQILIEMNDKIDMMGNNEKMFFARMLLSCLVDADYSASINFSNPKYIEEMDRYILEPDRLLEGLNTYRNGIINKSKANSKMNELRNEVYDSCVKAADKETGVFTLTAPTGTAKTLALLAFALNHAKKYGKERIFIVLPYLSIIEQNVEVYRKICKNVYDYDIVFEDDSNVDYENEDKNKDLVNRWGASIIVTSSVNFFETLFEAKSSKLRRLHNISNSIIVFDESQTLDSAFIGSTLEIMNLLPKEYNTTVLFSTATPLSYGYRKDIEWKPIEIIENPKDLYKRYGEIKKINVNWAIDKSYTYEDLYNMSKNNSSLYVFNTIEMALKMFKELKKHNIENCYMISSRLCKTHKQNVIKEIRERIDNGEKCIVVSTSCIEAGVDLSFVEVFRQKAPYSSLMQSSGRCVRNAECEGYFTIFDLQDENVKTKYPTIGYRNAALIMDELIIKYGGYIDINDLDILQNDYSRLFFNNSSESKDKEALIREIQNMNYEQTREEYKIIDDSASYVFIVPYEKEKAKYDKVYNMIVDNDYCISKSIIKASVNVRVNVFCSKKYKDKMDMCTRLKIRIGEDVEDSEYTNWFLVERSSNFYNEIVGLDFSSDEHIENDMFIN